ncbi:hypothetical protein D3C74_333210 [compost metagenome]
MNKYIVYEKAKEQGIELDIDDLRAHSIVTTLHGVGVDPQSLLTSAADNITEPKSQVDSSKEKQFEGKDGDEAGSGKQKEKQRDTQKQKTQKENESQQQGQNTSQDKELPSNNTENSGTSPQKQNNGTSPQKQVSKQPVKEPVKEPAKEPVKNGAANGTKKDSSLNNKEKSESDEDGYEGKKLKNSTLEDNKPMNTNPDKKHGESGHKGK